MKKHVPINAIAELQAQGRHDEAMALYRESTTPAQREAVKRAFAGLREAVRNIDWEKTEDIMERFRAARENPDHPNAPPWLHIGELTPRQIATFYRRLLDPRSERGRPAGVGPVLTDEEAIAAMHELVVNEGMFETTAARRVLKERGIKGELKGRAGHLVQVYRSRHGMK